MTQALRKTAVIHKWDVQSFHEALDAQLAHFKNPEIHLSTSSSDYTTKFTALIVEKEKCHI